MPVIAQDADVSGHRIGQFALLRKLGEGGMGQVFLAEHAILKHRRVIKTLLPQFTANPTIVDRFVNEARAAAAICHRNIIAIEDCAQMPSGEWYIVMAYLQGETLAEWEMAQRGRSPDWPSMLAIICQIANGLMAAHAIGIVHRDLKPENIFLVDRAGHKAVTILDFGIAKLRLSGAELTGHTQTGQVFGTPTYMAPEQMRDAKEIDARADIYALAVIVYQLATGGFLPFQNGNVPNAYSDLSLPELFLRQSTTAPIDPGLRRALPPGWRDLIMESLRLEPAGRPASVKDFAVRLARVTAGGAEVLRSVAPELALDDIPAHVSQANHSQGRSPWVWGVVVGLMVTGGIGAGLVAKRLRGSSTNIPVSLKPEPLRDTQLATPEISAEPQVTTRTTVDARVLQVDAEVRSQDAASPSGWAADEPAQGAVRTPATGGKVPSGARAGADTQIRDNKQLLRQKRRGAVFDPNDVGGD